MLLKGKKTYTHTYNSLSPRDHIMDVNISDFHLKIFLELPAQIFLIHINGCTVPYWTDGGAIIHLSSLLLGILAEVNILVQVFWQTSMYTSLGKCSSNGNTKSKGIYV